MYLNNINGNVSNPLVYANISPEDSDIDGGESTCIDELWPGSVYIYFEDFPIGGFHTTIKDAKKMLKKLKKAIKAVEINATPPLLR